MIKDLIKLLIVEELENFTDTPFQVWFDMDGVLANFDGEIKKNSSVAALNLELKAALASYPKLAKMHPDDLKNLLSGEQTDPDLKRIKKLFNKIRNISYAIASAEGHFLNLEVLPGAKFMVSEAQKITGKMPNILTAPMESHKNCEEEKKIWIEKHFSGQYANFYCTQDKHNFAKSKFDILIDDRPKYINKFRAAGGTAILHTDPNKTIKELKQIVDTY